MDASIIAIALGAFAILSSKKKLETLASDIQGLSDKQEAELELLASEAASERVEASDLAISLIVSISSIGDTLWNASVTWHIRNKGTQPYYLSDLQSTFSIAGYKVNTWVPGNRSEVRIPEGTVVKNIPIDIPGKKLKDGSLPAIPTPETFIRPGATVEIKSSINDAKLWKSNETIKVVRNKIKEVLGVDILSKVNFPVDADVLSSLIVCDSTSFKLSTPYSDSTNTIQITKEIPSALVYPAYVKVYTRYGSNALTWNDEEEK